ncbi:MAG TPA: hypothetical protein VIA18_16950, partial [Polyangia bacterium]|nr:hypothetical protein [Polyangia bacterium]
MVARAALILMVAVAGCAGDDVANQIGNEDMSFAGGSDMAEAPGCLVSIAQPTTPYVPATLTASTDSTFADASWSVALAGSPAPATQVDATGRVVTVNATVAGTYTFTVRFANDDCVGVGSIDLLNPTGAMALYRFRGLPPSGSKNAPTDTMVVLTGGTPLANRPVRLDSGSAASGVLSDGMGPIPGEIRFVGMSVPDADTRAGASGTFSVAVGTTDYYQPLLIPDSPLLAPHLGSETEGYALSQGSFTVSAGAPITGSVSDGANPIAGAGVVLRAGLLPSGLGTSAADGTFSLRAEALTTAYQLSVSSDGWPTLTLDDIVV